MECLVGRAKMEKENQDEATWNGISQQDVATEMESCGNFVQLRLLANRMVIKRNLSVKGSRV